MSKCNLLIGLGKSICRPTSEHKMWPIFVYTLIIMPYLDYINNENGKCRLISIWKKETRIQCQIRSLNKKYIKMFFFKKAT